jgi:hypothetical protein
MRIARLEELALLHSGIGAGVCAVRQDALQAAMRSGLLAPITAQPPLLPLLADGIICSCPRCFNSFLPFSAALLKQTPKPQAVFRFDNVGWRPRTPRPVATGQQRPVSAAPAAAGGLTGQQRSAGVHPTAAPLLQLLLPQLMAAAQ